MIWKRWMIFLPKKRLQWKNYTTDRFNYFAFDTQRVLLQLVHRIIIHNECLSSSFSAPASLHLRTRTWCNYYLSIQNDLSMAIIGSLGKYYYNVMYAVKHDEAIYIHRTLIAQLFVGFIESNEISNSVLHIFKMKMFWKHQANSNTVVYLSTHTIWLTLFNPFKEYTNVTKCRASLRAST